MVNNEAIEAAIEDLESQEKPNYAATARSFNVDQNTLARRFKGQSVSISEAHSRSQKLLSNAQEAVLIEHIKELADLGIPPSPQIIRNLVVETVKHPVSER